MQNDKHTNCVTYNSTEFTGWVNGFAQNMPESFCGVTQDTRKLQPGMLYVALRGENFDGHDFVGKAFDAGAAAAMVDESWSVPESLSEAPLIHVTDPVGALLDAAHSWREISSAKIIGITGSSGKTTTKEISKAIFSAGGRVYSTEGNQNNHIGLPLSILAMQPDCEFGIFELGTNHPGEISVLADSLRPDIGLITCIGTSHIEYFGSTEAIAREKGVLLSSMALGGCAVLSMDERDYALLKGNSSVPVFSVSMCNNDADFFGEILDEMIGRLRITECCSRIQTELVSGLPGIHNAGNLLLAFAAARIAGISGDLAAEGLKNLSAPGMRCQRIDRDDGISVINDAYNANPESVKAVLKLFKALECSGRKIAVLGDMLELGELSATLHRDVGAVVAEVNPDFLCLVGDLSSQYTAGGAVCKGFSQKKVLCFPDASSAGRALSSRIEPGDMILLKASRGMHLEDTLNEL